MNEQQKQRGQWGQQKKEVGKKWFIKINTIYKTKLTKLKINNQTPDRIRQNGI